MTRRLFILAFVMQLLGCAAVLALLPKVIAAVEIASQAVNAIQVFADGHAMDAELKQKIDTAANAARAALAAAVSAAKGSEELASKDVAQAFDDFGKAYQELLDLVKDIGVSTQDSPKLAARPGVLVVPSSKALRAEMDR